MTSAFEINTLHMAGDIILTKNRGVNLDYLFQTMYKKSDFKLRLPVDLNVPAFFKHLFIIDKNTTW